MPLPELNLGGGFDVPCFAGEQPIDIYRMAAALHETLCNGPELLATTRLSLELGRWLVGEAGVYLTRVLDRTRELRRRPSSPPTAAAITCSAPPAACSSEGAAIIRSRSPTASTRRRRAGHGHRLPRDAVRRVRRRGHAPPRGAGRPDRDLLRRRLCLSASPQAWESRPAGARDPGLGVDRLDEIEAVRRGVEAERGPVARFQRLAHVVRAAIAPARPARGSRPSSAPGGGGSCAPPHRRGFPRRRGSTSSRSSVFTGLSDWQWAERKVVKSWRPISCAAPSRIASTSSGTATCHTRPASSAGGARRSRMR